MKSIKYSVIGLLCATWILFVPSSARAQWAREGDFSNRFRRWEAVPNAALTPIHALGTSCLAFDSDGTLYTVCEKYPYLLVFPEKANSYHVELTGVRRNGSVPDIDLEAMSIHEGRIYLTDEDKLLVYSTPLKNPGPMVQHQIRFGGQVGFDGKSTTDNPSDLSSIEGMVISNKPYFKAVDGFQGLQNGPFVYLLDERDNVHGTMVAKIYVGTFNADKSEVIVEHRPVSFELRDETGFKEGFRFSELFEFRDQLFALKTRRPQTVQGVRRDGVYKVVQCDLNSGTIVEIADFTAVANAGKPKYDTNFEGAAVGGDGRLYLTTDNESAVIGGEIPLPHHDAWRGETSIVALRAK